MKLLIVGQNVDLVLPVPDIFSSAGFEITCISTKKIFGLHPSIDQFYLVEDTQDLLETASEVIKGSKFNLVVIADDNTIRSILDSDLSLSDKEYLLPVVSKDHFDHLGSKIGLSIALNKAGLCSPQFEIVKDKSDLICKSESMGFPLMLKGDFSACGSQTYEINNQQELQKCIDEFDHFPAVIQRKIIGDLISIEGLYINAELVHFSYSLVLQTEYNKKFTPSVVRSFSQPGLLNREIFDDLNALGKALGLNGFANISCIRSHEDGRHYYFEADVRPNVWVGYTKYFGDDIVISLKNYFLKGETLTYPVEVNAAYPEKITIPHFLRINTFDFIINKHSVWKFIPKNRLAMKLLLKRHFFRKLKNLITLKFIRRRLKSMGYG